MNTLTSNDSNSSGFDAPVGSLEEDALQRWPIARQIYSVATGGPPEWSVRVGVYGEWGSGKTSVLNFVSRMARDEDHFVVSFSPWGYLNDDELWPAFAESVVKVIETAVGNLPETGRVRNRMRVENATQFGAAIAGAFRKEAIPAAEKGIEYIKKKMVQYRTHLGELRHILNGRRVIVLFDDLDRAAEAVVPSVLFALKEIMDVPSFSYVCAFDPKVVGRVLSKHNPGFGDGEAYLEKIIDYPFWLGPPKAKGLQLVALSEAQRHCSYVPQDDIRNIMPLLPSNPRSVRRLIRMLSSLKTQVSRHYEWELEWSTILASTVLRIRFQSIAEEVLSDSGFWKQIDSSQSWATTSEQRKSVKTQIVQRVDDAIKVFESDLSSKDRSQLIDALHGIGDRTGKWFGPGLASVEYQMSLYDAPHAVTWKEFDKILNAWNLARSADALGQIILDHANGVQRSAKAVATELVVSAARKYSQEIRGIFELIRHKDADPHKRAALDMIDFLEALLFGSAPSIESLTAWDWIPIEELVEVLVPLADERGKFQQRCNLRVGKFLEKIVFHWKDELALPIQALRPCEPLGARYDGKKSKTLHKNLNKILLDRIADSALDGLKRLEFVSSVSHRHEGTRELRFLLLDFNGAFWSGRRKAVAGILRKAKDNFAVQENAINFLVWFHYLLKEEPQNEEAGLALNVLKLPIAENLWKAAISNPLMWRQTIYMEEKLVYLESVGIVFNRPSWWKKKLSEVG